MPLSPRHLALSVRTGGQRDRQAPAVRLSVSQYPILQNVLRWQACLMLRLPDTLNKLAIISKRHLMLASCPSSVRVCVCVTGGGI